MDSNITFLADSIDDSTVVNGTTNAIKYAFCTEDNTTDLIDIHGTAVGKHTQKFLGDVVTVRGVTKKIGEFLPGGFFFPIFG